MSKVEVIEADRKVVSASLSAKIFDYIKQHPRCTDKQIAEGIGLGNDKLAVAEVRALRKTDVYEELVKDTKSQVAEAVINGNVIETAMQMLETWQDDRKAAVMVIKTLLSYLQESKAQTMIQINYGTNQSMDVNMNKKDWTVRDIAGSQVPIHIPTEQAVREADRMTMNEACLRGGCQEHKHRSLVQNLFGKGNASANTNSESAEARGN